MNAAVWIRLLPNALLMFQSKYIKSMLFSSESTDKDDTSRGVSPKLYFVMLPHKGKLTTVNVEVKSQKSAKMNEILNA